MVQACRSGPRQGKTREAHDLLVPVYNWFTEGFDTADLKDAKAFLEMLRAQGHGTNEKVLSGILHVCLPRVRYTRLLMDASPEFPMHFLKSSITVPCMLSPGDDRRLS